MAPFSDDMSSMVFRRNIRETAGEIPLTGRMLMVLLELDGKKNLSAVSRTLQLEIETVKETVRKLQSLELVEALESSTPALNADFFVFLKSRLSLAVGPIAAFILEEEMQDFSGGSQEIPLHRAAELVDLLARQIHRNTKRVEFQQAMVEKIKEISS